MRQLGPIENVQKRAAAKIFMGVGKLHPLVSLQLELSTLPVNGSNVASGNYSIHVINYD